jgi:hypothetical protein
MAGFGSHIMSPEIVDHEQAKRRTAEQVAAAFWNGPTFLACFARSAIKLNRRNLHGDFRAWQAV